VVAGAHMHSNYCYSLLKAVSFSWTSARVQLPWYKKGSYGLLIDTSDRAVVLRDVRWYGIRHLGLIISHDDKDHNGMQEQVMLSFHPKFMDPYKDDVISFGPIRAENCMATTWNGGH